MISAPQPEAVEAGYLVLRDGGNAVDAAVACALVQTAVDPQMSGIAGFGCMHILAPRQGVHQVLDFHGRAPLASREDMWADLVERETEDGFGFVLRGRVNEIGYGSITTPMTLKALATALERWGTRPLAELIRPAIAHAEEGVLVRPHMAYYWNLVSDAGRVSTLDRFRAHPEARRIYLKDDGTPRKPGEVLRNPDLARTYRRIAEHGADDFYTGALAAEIAADMAANGALLGAEDLARVAPEDRQPLWGTYRGRRVATNPPPGGGIMVLEMLNILAHFDLAAMGHNSPDYIATVSEAMKIATVDKDRHVGDPRFVDVPVDRLLSADHAAAMAARIRSGEKTAVPRYRADGAGAHAESRDTTQVCAVDAQGTCVTMTHSLGMPAGVVTPGLGFMYNGCMGVFDPRPGQTGSVQPGKARFTAMCPTILFDGDGPELLIGAPGGTYITMGVLQGILNVIDFGMDAQQAVSAPRFCTTSEVIDVTNRIPRFVQRDLEARGYAVRRSYLNYHFAGVHALRCRGGVWDGGADPARDGMVMAC
ncbi:MAG: gamma-glutamyltransferase family protein [Hyphomicrobiales bacterium]|nr:gamma-glutamyltransferase family protein [Hyphomicrobiales bacterium]